MEQVGYKSALIRIVNISHFVSQAGDLTFPSWNINNGLFPLTN